MRRTITLNKCLVKQQLSSFSTDPLKKSKIMTLTGSQSSHIKMYNLKQHIPQKPIYEPPFCEQPAWSTETLKSFKKRKITRRIHKSKASFNVKPCGLNQSCPGLRHIQHHVAPRSQPPVFRSSPEFPWLQCSPTAIAFCLLLVRRLLDINSEIEFCCVLEH